MPGIVRPVEPAGGRLLRASSVAAITVGLSAAGHAAAGGPLPSAPGMLLVIALATAASYPLCRSRVSRVALVPLLALVQAALHPAFSMAAMPPWDPTATAHGHGAADSSLTMVLHHLAAGLVAAGLVLFTDRVINELVADRRLCPVLTLPTIEPFAAPACSVAPITRRQGRLSDLIDQAPRRGPPVAVRIG